MTLPVAPERAIPATMQRVYHRMDVTHRACRHVCEKISRRHASGLHEPAGTYRDSWQCVAYTHAVHFASDYAGPSSAGTTALGLLARQRHLVGAAAAGVGMRACFGSGGEANPGLHGLVRAANVLDTHGLLGLPEHAAVTASRWAQTKKLSGLHVVMLGIAICLRVAIQLPRAAGLLAFSISRQIPLAVVGALVGTFIWLRRPALPPDAGEQTAGHARSTAAPGSFITGRSAEIVHKVGTLTRELNQVPRSSCAASQKAKAYALACERIAKELIDTTESMKPMGKAIHERRRSREKSVRLWARLSLRYNRALCRNLRDTVDQALAATLCPPSGAEPLASALRHVAWVCRFYLGSFDNLERRLADDSVRRLPQHQVDLFAAALAADQSFGRAFARNARQMQAP